MKCAIYFSILIVGFNIFLAIDCDGFFPLRMPKIKPTRNEAYLCTGVEIGSDQRYQRGASIEYS